MAMWDRLKRTISARFTGDRAGYFVYVIAVPNQGVKDVLSFLPSERVFREGLATEAVIGHRVRSRETNDPIKPENFHENPAFVDLLHRVVAAHVPDHAAFRQEARRQGNGWVYVIDQRTPTPAGEVPPEDIIGSFEIREGRVVPNTYQRNDKHRLLTSRGIFKLDDSVHASLLDAINAAQDTLERTGAQ
jgi:hypothetical protein